MPLIAAQQPQQRVLKRVIVALAYTFATFAPSLGGAALIIGLSLVYSGVRFHNELPKDYSYLYGTNRPFAPSLARTDTGRGFDERSLAGSPSG